MIAATSPDHAGSRGRIRRPGKRRFGSDAVDATTCLTSSSASPIVESIDSFAMTFIGGGIAFSQ